VTHAACESISREETIKIGNSDLKISQNMQTFKFSQSTWRTTLAPQCNAVTKLVKVKVPSEIRQRLHDIRLYLWIQIPLDLFTIEQERIENAHRLV
jgi:hypothetical protein